MTHRSWVAMASPLLSLACGALQAAPETSNVDLGRTGPGLEVAAHEHKSRKTEKAKQPAPVVPRKVGDYFVHRFSGSFRQGPLTLTERVVRETKSRLFIDYTLEDGSIDKTLRVELDKKTERPVKVAEVTDAGLNDVPISTYEAMLEQTIFVPDVNDALLGKNESTCLVGPKELACETKQYRVFVGDREATLSITHSNKVPGRDIGGEVTAVDGSLIYRAELLEAGHTPNASASVAVK